MDLANSIGILVGYLNTIRNNSTDPVQQQKIGALLTEVIFPLWDATFNQQIAANTPQFTAATTALNAATQSAQQAIQNLAQTQKAIGDVVTAAKAIDQVVGTVLPILALM